MGPPLPRLQGAGSPRRLTLDPRTQSEDELGKPERSRIAYRNEARNSLVKTRLPQSSPPISEACVTRKIRDPTHRNSRPEVPKSET
jgi:hypothetical protein